ncbi:MAG: hypothetical protein L0I76_24905 [Pseudonocardia sp.]|nr:hypothetical protein [Pseudonocardia sp.]
MWWGWLASFASALCYGLASVVQALAARAEPATTRGVDPMLLVRLVQRWRFVVGIGLDLAGFAAQLAALQVLPLFVVQAGVAASLAVTAVAARPLLGSVLGARAWAAVAVTIAGLGLLAGSAGVQGSGGAGAGTHLAVLVAAVVLGGVGVGAARAPRRVRAPALGLVAGLGFGVVAIAGRLLTELTPAALIGDPASYAIVLGGVVAFTFYATALQAASVTTVTTLLVVGETVVPALVGVTLLGDHTRTGLVWLASLGFVAVLAGAAALARYGEPGSPGVACRASDVS